MSLELYQRYITSQSEAFPVHDPLIGFNHDLKHDWLSFYNTAYQTSGDHQSSYEHAELCFYQTLSQQEWENWIFQTANFLIKKPKVQKTQKPETHYFGCQLITLTLPKDMTHDEGRKYLTDYVSEYFMGKKPELKKKKPKTPKPQNPKTPNRDD